MILTALSNRGDKTHVIVYHEGRGVNYNNTTIYRSPKIPFLNHIRPGFSWKKVICDVFMFFKAIHLVLKNHYHVVHAVEESVYIALILKWVFKIHYVYDMDSSLAQQMIETYPSLRHLDFLLNFFERLAVRNAIAVVPVCDALAEHFNKYGPKKVVVLQDVSLLDGQSVVKTI
jgi:hypothetical protein